jgi:hypothetical protein
LPSIKRFSAASGVTPDPSCGAATAAVRPTNKAPAAAIVQRRDTGMEMGMADLRKLGRDASGGAGAAYQVGA